jgi:hypothetical protein
VDGHATAEGLALSARGGDLSVMVTAGLRLVHKFSILPGGVRGRFVWFGRCWKSSESPPTAAYCSRSLGRARSVFRPNDQRKSINSPRSSLSKGRPKRPLQFHTAAIFWNFESDTGLGHGVSNLGSRTMFKMPAYDPISIVIIGFGILVTVALMMIL